MRRLRRNILSLQDINHKWWTLELSCKLKEPLWMAELKSFAADAWWALIHEARSAFTSPEQRRWCLGVTAYLVAAFLMGNALNEMWNIYLLSSA
jgi:hypothetical protein